MASEFDADGAMGELTENPVTRSIEWTGERCVPWADDIQVIYEHYHRYALASGFTAGRRVLDLATGEGYGAALMARRARHVVGVDIDRDTVEHARATYRADNLTFELGSITDPQLLAGTEPFDVVTCFEAIEHVHEHDRLMELVTGRLAEDGLLLISTPDVAVYTHEHGNDNPFHVKELTEDEFAALLRHSFRHVAMFRQNLAVGSLLVPAAGATGEALAQTLGRDGDAWTVSPGAPHTYLVAVASDAPLPDLPSAAVLVDPEQALVRQVHDRVAAGREEVDELRARLELLAAQSRAHETAAAEANAELRTSRATAAELERQRDELAGQRDELEGYRDELATMLAAARREVDRGAVRLDWLAESIPKLERRCALLAEENAELRLETSAAAQRLINRYRAAIERFAPRGTIRRDLYERAWGRQTGVLPAPEPAPDLAPVPVGTSDEPLVSIIVPVHGQWAYTRQCLASIEECSAFVPFEVVVVDDCSPDDTAALVEQCHGVRLVRTPSNLGFVGACNTGARAARGELLVFLNNDTIVRPGWLDALVRTAEADDRVGLVGAKLVYPDGRLQEAGGIVWSDGTGWNYGRGQDPADPEFNVLRDVDYCSGAAILVRGDVFAKVGGFDEQYAPAYYEDTDLAFAVRAAGFRAVVQPEAVVVHHEGASHGTDVSSGVKRFQELNRGRFVEKWADQLANHRPGPGAGNLWAARQRTATGHDGGVVLVMDHQVPRPDMDSGSVRMAAILDELTGLGHRVVFFPANGALPEQYGRRFQRRGVTIVASPQRQADVLRELAPELRLAILSRPNVAWQVLTDVRGAAPNCVVAYDTVDLHFLRLRRQADNAERLGRTREAAGLRRQADASWELEVGLVRACDVTFAVSDAERDLLAELAPGADVRVLSNVHPVSPLPASPAGRCGIVFVGSFDHLPNRDAAEWMARQIMPLVRARVAEAELHVVGSNPTPQVCELAGDGITVHGWVPSLTPLYAGARVAVAPLRFGAGVKGKVGESAGLGVPTVGTTLAFEGMRLRPGHDVLVGDTAQEIADAVVRLLTDEQMWRTVSAAGKAAIAAQFGPEPVRETLAATLELYRPQA